MTQGGYPSGCSQSDHDRYFGDEEPEVDQDADYDEHRDYEDHDDHLEVEPVDDGEDDWRDAA
jgi:hypothetical protein